MQIIGEGLHALMRLNKKPNIRNVWYSLEVRRSFCSISVKDVIGNSNGSSSSSSNSSSSNDLDDEKKEREREKNTFLLIAIMFDLCSL
jgi:hypothetical protein